MSGSDRYIGLMSGTSLDGVDAALVDFSGAAPACIGTAYVPFPDVLRQELLALHDAGNDELHRAATLANRLADIYAEAVAAVLAGQSDAVRAIGCHGQTVRHAPQSGYTIQLNNPALLAERTGISVVAEFRSRDIAAGGQGAPLVPAFHDAVFRTMDRDRVIVNIGGIANITQLARGESTRGFDTGPGNMLLDAWALRHLGKPYDEGGVWAASGQVLDSLLQRLLAHDFLKLSPPKSCGREEFNIDWLESCLDGTEDPADVQATLAEFTVASIAAAIDAWCERPTELFVCGGGTHNTTLLRGLERHLPGVAVATTDALGLAADWVEAVAFAWLARQTVQRLPGNLPEVTGAAGRRVLGAIYPA